MRTSLSFVFVQIALLVLATQDGKKSHYGLEVVSPGVVGAQLKHLKNKTGLEQGRVARLNEKLKNKVSAHVGEPIRRMKNKVHQLFPRSDEDTEGFPELSHNFDGNFDGDLDILEVAKADATSASIYAEPMQNKLTYYLLNITLGSPPQQFMVQVDTGSSDLWVPGRIIQFNGFDSKHSSSFKLLSDDFTIKYVKDSAQGFWGVDTFGFGGTSVQVNDLQFAVATSAPDATMGILGIGPLESEVSQVAYPNLPLMLVREGLISRSVYSMYMGGLDADEGTILFGGVDKAKYRKLTTLPIVSKTTVTVALDFIALTNSQGPKEDENNILKMFDEPERSYFASEDRDEEDLSLQNNDVIVSRRTIDVLLDTGTSLTYLPSDVVNSIAASFKATFESDVGMWVVHQKDLDNNAMQGINFQFENQVIYMPKEELFWPLSWFSLEPSPYYAMTILASESSLGYNILGDSFLRNAYVIYDLDEKEIHLGQYYPSPYTHIVPI